MAFLYLATCGGVSGVVAVADSVVVVEGVGVETENMIIGVCLYIYKDVCLSSFITIYSAQAHVFLTINKMAESTKKIHVPMTALVSVKNKSHNASAPAPTAPKKRLITTSKQWNFQPDELTPEYQLFLLSELRRSLSYSPNATIEACSELRRSLSYSPNATIEACSELRSGDGAPANDTTDEILRKRVLLLKQHIHLKWYGYRAQDMEKNLFRPELLISENDIVELLLDSRLLCFYCRHPILLLYENVRESSQWSIERIDNQYGHNRENVVVACLSCNLRRKTMYYERFRMTKQLNITKQS
jgi:5-methylcytosine-specific restriction endonuclease McrA